MREDFAEGLDVIKGFRGDSDAPGHHIQHHEFDASGSVAGGARDFIGIDGSYSFIFSQSNIWHGVVRVGALHYRHGADGEPATIIDTQVREHAIVVSTRKDVVNQQSQLHQDFYSKATKFLSEQNKAMEMASLWMKHYEEELALEIAGNTRNGIIGVDGSLVHYGGSPGTEKLIAKCSDAGNLLAGITKDSNTHMFGKNRTDEEVLASAGIGGTCYVRAPSDFEVKEEKRARGGLYGDIYFTRLHPNSQKWFRIDIATMKDKPKEAFGALASYANSRIYPGYVYPMLEAHRLVVMVRHFHDAYEDMLIETAMRMGMSMNEIMASLTHIDGRRLGAFHEFLDKVAREM